MLKVGHSLVQAHGKNILINNIEKIHTTPMGENRIKRNLQINGNVFATIKDILLKDSSTVYKSGKNYYCEYDNIIITINSHSFTIITAQIKNKY